MRCHVCGGWLERTVTNLPFRLSSGGIVVIKGLPVFECDNCIEFSLDDEVMERVEALLDRIDDATELEVIRYVA